MTTVFSSDVRDLVSRYHRDVLSLRAQLAQETTAAPTSLYKPRAAQIHIGAARMDTCQNLKTALKDLEETFIHNVQSKLHSERELELKQLEDDFEEEVLALTSSSVNHSDQHTATSTTKFESPTNTNTITSITTSPHPAAQFGTKMSLLPLKPNPKSKALPTTNNKKSKPATPCTIAALTNTATSITTPAAAQYRASTTSTAIPGARSVVTTGNGTATTRNSHSSTTTSSRLCNPARDALNEAKRLSIVGAYAESASAFRHAGKVQDAYTYRNSIPKNPRLHFGDTASVGQLRSSNQRLINASQRNVLRTEIDEKHLNEAIEEVKKRYQNAQERLRHRHTVEQHAAVSLAQLAMSAPAEEKHCSAIQRKLQKKYSANNINNNSNATTGDAPHDRIYYEEHDISGVVSDPDEMYTPYRVGSSRSSHTASRGGGGGYCSSTKAPAALRLSPALLGQQPYTTSAATSRPASAAAVRNMYGRPQASGGEGHYYSRPPTAGRVTATRSSPSRARSPFALHSADAHTAGHNHAVVATSGSVLDGVAAPPPFGTRPPSSKVASGTTSNSAVSRRLLLPRPQSAGGGVGTVGGSRPQTAHARLGLPHPTQHAFSTPSSSLVALCDAYGDLFVEEDDDDVENNNGSDIRVEDVFEEVRSNHLASSNQHNNNQPRVRSATATTTSESKYVQGGSRSRHNPRVNVTGTRYLQAVASLNRLHNNNTPNSVVIYE